MDTEELERSRCIDISIYLYNEDIEQYKAEESHVWEMDEAGQVDYHAVGSDYHNGPRCTRCGYSYCIHCRGEQQFGELPCQKDYKNWYYYTEELMKEMYKREGWQFNIEIDHSEHFKDFVYRTTMTICPEPNKHLTYTGSADTLNNSIVECVWNYIDANRQR